MRYAKVSRTISGRVLSFETGRIAKQAKGAVLGALGDTMVLSAVCSASARPGIDFFPLSVEYREKTYAAGKFPGGFIKREGRPKDKEILTCRLIDRPIRPLWPEAYKDEVQILATVLSAEKDIDPDLVAMNSSFLACHLAPLPFEGPVAAVRVARVDGKAIAFPTVDELDASDVDVVIASTRDAVVMVEGLATEISEEDFLALMDFAQKTIAPILDMMDELKEKAQAAPSTWKAPEVVQPPVYKKAKKDYASALKKAVLVQGKHERYSAVADIKKKAIADLVPDEGDDKDAIQKAVQSALNDLENEIMRELILKDGKRIDLRGLKDVRPITIEQSILPRTHGSTLFTRGETQAIVVATLGTPRDQQIVDGLVDEYAKRFDLQYNFPPYSVGEVKPVRGVGRREIGHGNLAERALSSVIPSSEKFPYTIRLVSEITESNGSSSMATVCGGTLALMDAGVPLRQPVAGIAMGLIKEGDKVAILSDILGTEDHLGDMDFKVAGTGRGITAVQMDIKVKGISRDIFAKALRQAREGRMHILREMLKAMPGPRKDISKHAPRLLSLRIPVEKIGMVIGPGGKMINKIQSETGAIVEIEDDGTVCISSTDADAANAARQMVEALTAEVEIGKIYQAKVVSLKDFGCFVEVLPGQEGLCHVSELAEEHVRSVGDVVSVGDIIPVKVVLRDEQGRLKLSRRMALQEGAQTEAPAKDRPTAPPPVRAPEAPARPENRFGGERDSGPPRPPMRTGRFGDDADAPPRERPADRDRFPTDRGPRGETRPPRGDERSDERPARPGPGFDRDRDRDGERPSRPPERESRRPMDRDDEDRFERPARPADRDPRPARPATDEHENAERPAPRRGSDRMGRPPRDEGEGMERPAPRRGADRPGRDEGEPVYLERPLRQESAEDDRPPRRGREDRPPRGGDRFEPRPSERPSRGEDSERFETRGRGPQRDQPESGEPQGSETEAGGFGDRRRRRSAEDGDSERRPPARRRH